MSAEEGDAPAKQLKIAVLGGQGVGKTTLCGNFLKGYVGEDDDMDELAKLMKPKDNNYIVELDYNSFRYELNIQELSYKDAKGNNLSSFDGVIYMFSCDQASSFVEVREFFIRQVAAEQDLKPRIVVGGKFDLVSESDLRMSMTARTENVYHANGSLNLKESKRWTLNRMLCDYIEIN